MRTTDIYAAHLRDCVPLSRDDEFAMATRMSTLRMVHERLLERYGNTEVTREAGRTLVDVRRRFVSANLRLVVSVARKYAVGKVPLDDLIQEGNIGLLIAVDRFDHTRNVRFSTYAVCWIRSRISHTIANHGRAVRVPHHISQASVKLHKARRSLESRSGRYPSLDDLATAVKMTPAQATIALQTTGYGLSFDTPLGDDNRTIADMIPDDAEAIDAEFVRHEAHHRVVDALSYLLPIEADILRKRFEFDGDALTLREIGALHSMSGERVRQIQNSALSKIRECLTSSEPDPQAQKLGP